MWPESVPAAETPLTVSELSEQIKAVLADEFPAVWVVGEISKVTPHQSGHIYLSLREGEKATIGAVIWRSQVPRMPAAWQPRLGVEVIAFGRVDVYPPHGKYQFVIERIIPKGLGEAEEALRRLKEKLLKRGYFAPERKKPLPAFPSRIALVTSRTGAAVRDMLEVIRQNWPVAEVLICSVRVQGATAAREVADAINRLNQLHAEGALPIDVMIIGRGGGSAEDLGAFNQEIVADAIFQSLIPVISAVGHEIDVTVADLVADRRAVTPTEAATLAVPDRERWLAQLQRTENGLRTKLQRRLDWDRERLKALAGRNVFRRPLDRIRVLEQALDDRSDRLDGVAHRRLDQARKVVAAASDRLKALSPLNVLARGYSLTTTEDGRLLRDATQVRSGDHIISRVARGSVLSRVELIRTERGDKG